MTRGRLIPACETITLKSPPSRECNSHRFGHCSSRLGWGLLETRVRTDFLTWRQSELAIMMVTPLIGIAEPDFGLSASSKWAQTPAGIDHMGQDREWGKAKGRLWTSNPEPAVAAELSDTPPANTTA